MSKHPLPRPLPQSLALPCTGVDSHAHLDLPGLIEQLPDLLDRARTAGLCRIGHVFMGPEAYATHLHTFDPYPQVFFLMAVHPCDAMQCTGGVFQAMREAFQDNPRLRAVGETGLDFYWKDCPPIVQEEAFRLHLDLARTVNRPVVVHSRDAAAASLRILEAEGLASHPLLWHCFSGDALDHLDRILANGWHVSIPGPVSYPANATLREAVARIPLDRLLVETDCPYLTPVPWRGKPNEPALSVFTALAMAEARHMDIAELWTACGNNALRFFDLL